MHLPIQTPLRMIKEHGNQSCKSPITLILNNLHSRPHTAIADLIRNPQVRGRERADNNTTPTELPLSLDGRGLR